MKNKYQFRGLSCVNKSWYISGEFEDNMVAGGILEWCYSAMDAENLLKKMQNHSEFSNLRIGCLLIESNISNEITNYLRNFQNYNTKTEFRLALEYFQNAIENIEESNSEYLTEDEQEYESFYFIELYQVRTEKKEMLDNYWDFLEKEGLKDPYYFEKHREATIKPMVDFDMLKNSLRAAGSTSILCKLFSNLSQDELKNLAIFLDCMKNPKFAILASRKLRNLS